MNYFTLSEETVAQARNADIIAFFEKYHGYEFTPKGNSYRCRQHQSLAVKNDRLSWYWHSKGIGGFGALDYLIKVENMPFREAVEAVAGITAATVQLRRETVKPKMLILPEKSGLQLRLYDYLCGKRGIDGDIVNRLIQEKKLYEDKRGNVVFVGYDEHNRARFAALRGTHGDCSFRMDCLGSDKRYGFNMACPQSERLYIFESAIDLMSHASLDKSEYNRLSLAGTSDTALSFFLNQHKSVKELAFCLDNDPAGREAAGIMAEKYEDRGYITRIELPKSKDFNEDLAAYRATFHKDKPKTERSI